MDIKVNAQSLNALSKEDQDKIRQIISGIFKEQHNLVADTGAQAPGPAAPAAMAKAQAAAFSNPFCTGACNLLESAAVAACGALSGPAVPICIAAAHAAGEFCRSKC